jgi:uncharacterized membrane protein
MRALAVLAPVLYFLLAHAATLTGLASLRAAAVAVLVVLLLAMLRGRWPLQIALLAALAGCLWLAPQPMQLLMYAPPVLVPLVMLALVARSLLPGRQPLIERFVWHMHGRPDRLSNEHIRYTRAVTVYWCGVFIAMATVNLALALFAPPALWSWIANIATYAMPLLAMLAEYAWRKRVFPVQQYRDVFDYLGRIIRLGPTFAGEFVRDARREDAHAPPSLHP